MEVRANPLALIVLLLSFAACSVGEVPTEGGSTITPDASASNNNNNNNDNTGDTNNAAGEASFNSMIKPLVEPRCTSCHANSTPPNLSSFAALEAKYKMKPGSANVLVTKGDHAGIQYFDAAQRTTVQNWIDSL